MKWTAVILFFIIVMTGCTSTYTVGSKESGAIVEYEQFNNHVNDQQYTMRLSTEEEKNCPKYYFFNHSRGFIEGVWRGLILGISSAVIIYLPRNGNHDSELARTLNGAMVGGSFIIGTPIVYSAIGHTMEYYF